MQWDEDENLEEIWEGRKGGRKEALCRWKSCKKVTEFVVHEHMSQGEEVKCTKEKNSRKDGLLKN